MTGSKTKNQTTTQTVGPPGFISTQQQYGIDEARGLYDEGLPDYYGGQTYADFSPETEQALNMMAGRATAGSPLVAGAKGQVMSTLNGDYLNSNPYLDTAIDNASGATIRNYQDAIFPTIAGGWSSSGRYGSGLYANAQDSARDSLADALASTAGDIAYGNYADERGRQTNAVGQAVSLADQDYIDSGMLGQVGAARDAQTQRGIDEDMARYNYDANGDATALDQFLQRLGLVTPGAGNTSTAVAPVAQPNAFGQALGLGLTGVGLFANRNNIMGGWGF